MVGPLWRVFEGFGFGFCEKRLRREWLEGQCFIALLSLGGLVGKGRWVMLAGGFRGSLRNRLLPFLSMRRAGRSQCLL